MFRDGLSVDEIRVQLTRILASAAVREPEELRVLLRFCVEKALCGEEDVLSEFILGAEIFKTSTDRKSAVQAHAPLLRSRMQQYYATEGRLDPILIEMPVAGYVPEFSRRTPVQAQPRPAVERSHTRGWVVAVILGVALAGLT